MDHSFRVELAADARGRAATPLDVFVCYSRPDHGFADQLSDALALYGFNTILDRHGFTEGVDWNSRLGLLIQGADSFIHVLSPDSVKSDICNWELEEAVRLGKRIIPVLCRALDEAQPPSMLAALNYIYFYEEPRHPGSGFGSGLRDLVKALETDSSWLREHTRFLHRAIEWESAGKTEDRLLSGPDLDRALAWLSRRPRSAPKPTLLHLDFISCSDQRRVSLSLEEQRRLSEVQLLKRRLEAKTDKTGTHVFISYRRVDAKVYAGRICDWLSSRP